MKAIINTLRSITPPRMIREAMSLYGTMEMPGAKNNPVIVNWAKETQTKDDNWYGADSIPWCGLFMAVVAQRSGWKVPSLPLAALSWFRFGKATDTAMLGDVLVFTRRGGGHVGLYVGESDTTYYVLGGNQSDKVCISELSKTRIHAIRRPPYRVKPDSVKQYIYSSSGELSINEQ
jgi:uncharacterized protein (TIGR02594 family)